MPKLENDAARLKSLSYLLSEALRIAKEGDNPIICAKIGDCADCIARDLDGVIEQLRKPNSN